MSSLVASVAHEQTAGASRGLTAKVGWALVITIKHLAVKQGRSSWASSDSPEAFDICHHF